MQRVDRLKKKHENLLAAKTRFG